MSNILLSYNLRRLREEHHYTQEQISEKLNISRQAYSNYETGSRVPNIDILIHLSDIYKTSLDALVKQSCPNQGIVHDYSELYTQAFLLDHSSTVYLSREDVELLNHYHAADIDDKKLTKKILGM